MKLYDIYKLACDHSNLEIGKLANIMGSMMGRNVTSNLSMPGLSSLGGRLGGGIKPSSLSGSQSFNVVEPAQVTGVRG